LPRYPTILTADELKRFDRDGYVVVRNAFAHEDAVQMQREWWRELSEVHGIDQSDPRTWRQPMGDLKRPKQSASERRIATPKVRAVVEDLLGPGAWLEPADWGRALVTFPEPGEGVVTRLWHWDNPSPRESEKLSGLFVVSFVGEVLPRGGGTLILSGSHRLLRRHEAALTAAELKADARTRRDLFFRSHPWLTALSGAAKSPPDRIAAFMEPEADVDGIAAKVVELTGEPGDMVFCQPDIVHCAAPNRGTAPRFMRIKPRLKAGD
jgi:ectoine hydroxylase-related dioxygenase (phytanoyl-CoA dioxygenase family)